jgi:P4 family phage/plasmid primase-like protien
MPTAQQSYQANGVAQANNVVPIVNGIPMLTVAPHLAATSDDAFASAMLANGNLAIDPSEDVVYRWEGAHWQALSDVEGERLAAKWLRGNLADKAGVSNARNAWSFFKLTAGGEGAVVPTPRPDGSVIIPTLRAYLRIDSQGRITAEAPDRLEGVRYLVAVDASKSVIGAAYTPQPVPEMSRFGRFLAHAQDDAEVRDFIQEQSALTLMPGQPQRAAWWYGAKGSGKGTLTTIVRRFHHRVVALDLKSLDGFKLEKIIGASLAVCSEVDRGRWCESIFKQLTGGDEVAVDRKGRPVVSYVSHAKFLICSNPDPWITDPTGAVHRRITPVRWTRTVDESLRNDHLVDEIFAHEADIVLDWMLDGVARMMKNWKGQFRPESQWPKQVKQWAREIRGTANAVASWIDDCDIAVSAHALHTRREIYNAFAEWAKHHGEHDPISETVFWRSFWPNSSVAASREPAQHRSAETGNGKRTMLPLHRIALEEEDRRIHEPAPDLSQCNDAIAF